MMKNQDMALVGKDLVKYKQILFQTMRDFDKFCKNYSLTYYGAFGTAIGAVRHKGLIPWDDDIDVLMPREDFEKFVKLHKEADDCGYEIVDTSNDDYYLFFAKFCNKNTTIVEQKECLIPFGIYVDIFPLDKFDGTYEENKRLFLKYDQHWSDFFAGSKKYSFKDVVCAIVGLHPRYFWQIIKDTFYYGVKRKKNRAEARKIEMLLMRNKGTYLANITGHNRPEQIFFKNEWFIDTIDMPFEDFSIPIPVGYDAMLTQFYGDYMTPPPVEKQPSIHKRFYYNLEKRLTVEEIKRIKNL